MVGYELISKLNEPKDKNTHVKYIAINSIKSKYVPFNVHYLCSWYAHLLFWLIDMSVEILKNG